MTEFDPDKFYDALKAWCELRGISMRGLALKLGMHPNSIHCYGKRSRKTGKKKIEPGLYKAAKMADALGITLDQLAAGPYGEGLRDG